MNLSSSQIIAHRFKQLSRTLQDEIEKNYILKNELNHNFSILTTLIHHETLGPIIKNIKNRIYKSEKNNDFLRNRKLKLLLNNSELSNKPSEIKIINFTKTNKIIPENVLKILSFGMKNPIGGISFKNDILNHVERMFTHWLKYADTLKLDCFCRSEIRSLICVEVQKLNKCTTPTSSARELKQFIQNDKSIIFVPIDKSKDLAVLDVEDYTFKLNSIFSPDKFEKLSLNPLQSDLLLFRKVIYKLKPYLSISDYHLIEPSESIKKGNGILNVKKPGMPVRPIISSIFSITSGAEKFILKIVSPLLKKCTFSLKSTKQFTETFVVVFYFNLKIGFIDMFRVLCLHINFEIKHFQKLHST